MTNKARCPNCQSTNHAKILWGLPADMREIEEQLEKKEIVLGGCIVTGSDPKWECNDCLTRWGQRDNAKRYTLNSTNSPQKYVIR